MKKERHLEHEKVLAEVKDAGQRLGEWRRLSHGVSWWLKGDIGHMRALYREADTGLLRDKNVYKIVRVLTDAFGVLKKPRPTERQTRP